jgi:hypothetical protein
MGMNTLNGKIAIMIDLREGEKLNKRLNKIEGIEEKSVTSSLSSFSLSSSLKIPIPNISINNGTLSPTNSVKSMAGLRRGSTTTLSRAESKQNLKTIKLLEMMKQEAAKQTWGSVEEKEKKLQMLRHDIIRLIVRDYLQNDNIDAMQFLSKIAIKSRRLGGFNLLVGDFSSLYVQ